MKRGRARRGVEESGKQRRRRLCTTAEASLGPPLAHLNTRSAGRRDRAETAQNIKENTPVLKRNLLLRALPEERPNRR